MAQASTEQSTEPDDGPPEARRGINELGHRLKQLFEEKRWREFGEELGACTLWFFDEPLALEQLRLAELLLATGPMRGLRTRASSR